MVEKLEPDFLSSLITETKERASRNPGLAQDLKAARKSLDNSAPEFESLASSQLKVRCGLFGLEVSCWVAVAAGVLIFAIAKM